MSDTMTTGLNGDQGRRFLEDGFIIVRDLQPRAAIQPFIDELKQCAQVRGPLGEIGLQSPERD